MENRENRTNKIEQLREQLFGLAFAYRDTKIWKKIKDRQALAVKRGNGEILYVCILDKKYGENWVTVFTRDEIRHFSLVLRSQHDSFQEEFTDFYEIISIECSQCRIMPKHALTEYRIWKVQEYAEKTGASLAGKCAYPDFARFKEYQEAKELNDPEDMERLSDVLEALCALSEVIAEKTAAQAKKLIPLVLPGKTDRVPVMERGTDGKYALAGEVPFPAWEKPFYPVYTGWDPAVIKSIRKKCRHGKIACGVIWGAETVPWEDPVLRAESRHPEDAPGLKDDLDPGDARAPDDDLDWCGEKDYPDDSENDLEYIYPALFLIVDVGSGKVLGCEACLTYRNHFDVMASRFLEILAGRKTRPSQVIARDERTYRLLEKAMEAAGIDLTVDGYIEAFLTAEESLQLECFDVMAPVGDYGLWDDGEDNYDKESRLWNLGGSDELDEFGEFDFPLKNIEPEISMALKAVQSVSDQVLLDTSDHVNAFLRLFEDFPMQPETEREYEALKARLERLGMRDSNGFGADPFAAGAVPDRPEGTGNSAKKKKNGKKQKDGDSCRQLSLLDMDFFGTENEERDKFIRDYLWDEEEEDGENGKSAPKKPGTGSPSPAQILQFPQNWKGSAERNKEPQTPLSYVIRVSLGRGFNRDIQIDADDNFDNFHRAIQRAVEFDDDHLYAFFMDNKVWSKKAAIFSPRETESSPRADTVTLRQCALSVGSKFMYLFDYGDEWRFQCRVTKVLDVKTAEAYIVKGKGSPPVQYR